MRRLLFIIIAGLLLTLMLPTSGGWAQPPPKEKVAKLQEEINRANDFRENVERRALNETVRKFGDEYAKAKTDAEREKVVARARRFLQERLKVLKKAKDEAFQRIIREVDKLYKIDTRNVKGEPTFSQDVQGEGECYPDGRVRLGPRAFTSPGWVASTKKHEATHADQAAEGRWPRGAVERHDAEIEAYGREITSADTMSLTDAERAEVQRRLHNHLRWKKAALINEIEAARASMDTDKQRKELDKIAGKIRDVQKLEEKGDEEAAMEKKNDAIKELNDLIKKAKGKAKDTLEKLKDHVEDLKKAQIFVIKADTIENLRDARDAATTTPAQKEEINKIIGKLKKIIDLEKKGDEKEALKIKKDALKEINDLLKDAKGETKDNLEKAKERVEKLIKIETKIPEKVFVPKFKFYLGYLYTKPTLKEANENLDKMNERYHTNAPSMQIGTGYNGRVFYMLSPNLGLGAGWESIAVEKVSDSFEGELEGIYFYHLVSWETSMNGAYAALLLSLPGPRVSFNLIAQIGSYTAKYRREGRTEWMEWEEYEVAEGEGRGTGYKAVVGMEFTLSRSFAFFIEGGYRSLVVTAEGNVLRPGTEDKEQEKIELDYSGSEIKAGIVGRF